MHTYLQWIRLFLLGLWPLIATAQEFPVLYKGRFRPADAYARQWLYDIYHAPTIKKKDLSAFHTSSSSALNLLWSLDALGHQPYLHSPLFWIGSAETKRLLALPLKQDRFSYQELSHLKEDAEFNLLFHVREIQRLIDELPPLEQAFRQRFTLLQAQNLPSKEIEKLLERDYPLKQRLRQASSLFHALPSRDLSGEWFPLKALLTQVYHAPSNSLKPIGNFTLFSDSDFENIRHAYLEWHQAMHSTTLNTQKNLHDYLTYALQQAYQPLAGQIHQKAHGKSLYYPTLTQLKIESLYVSYPWIPLLIALYTIGAGLFLLSSHFSWIWGNRLAFGIMLLAILCHTGLLAMRCYILNRPPVSNMFETVIYVPWIAACMSLLIPSFRRYPPVLLAACLTSIGLLVVLEVTDLNQSLDQVQAVLDSQFWLTIHVLLVVGSYGVFILGAILGHFYLGSFLFHRRETPQMNTLVHLILQTLYVGTFLLITGTILGGIWAAESWGRFWDWDPKEAWAFISSCFYLIWIHAYRFHRIGSFGLAFGSVAGLLAISFTWYGVNYILGTGLHSYGFGSGGENYYYAFLLAEVLFLSLALGIYARQSLFCKS